MPGKWTGHLAIWDQTLRPSRSTLLLTCSHRPPLWVLDPQKVFLSHCGVI